MKYKAKSGGSRILGMISSSIVPLLRVATKKQVVDLLNNIRGGEIFKCVIQIICLHWASLINTA